MVIVKHETHHLHDFVVKFVIFNVNRVNFYQEQCTVTLIQRKRRSKNRLGAETIAALPLLLRAATPPLRAVWTLSSVNMGAEKNMRCLRPAYACSVKPASDDGILALYRPP